MCGGWDEGWREGSRTHGSIPPPSPPLLLKVCDEPPQVSTHSTFGLFVDDTSFLTDVPLVGTPPLAVGVSAPGCVSTPAASTPIADQPHPLSTPDVSHPVSREPTDATPPRSGGGAPQKSGRRAPKVLLSTYPVGLPCLLRTCSARGVVLTAACSAVCAGQGEEEEGTSAAGGEPSGRHVLCQHQFCCQ